MEQATLYEFEDVLELKRTRTEIARWLEIDPAQITRWNGEIPAKKQLEIMHIFDHDHELRRDFNKIKRRRLEEKDDGT